MEWKKRIAVYGGLLGGLLLLLSLVRPYRITEISLNYSLMEGDIVWAENLTAGIHVPSFFFYIDRHLWEREEGIGRGDLLVFRHPLDRRLYIKRCVALPGDRVMQRDKHLYLQISADSQQTLEYGRRLKLPLKRLKGMWWLEDPYTSRYKVTHVPEVTGPLELIDYPDTLIPPHHYFMMGDFRDNSTDSRFFGPVPYRYIYYRIFSIWKKSRDLEEISAEDPLRGGPRLFSWQY